ncbi:MAG: YkuS family protein [Bacillota bacterium]|nr:YkuS family protein [Bacillota bacterium]
MKKIAISPQLTNVKQELEQQGYQVVNLEKNNWQDASAVVVSGMDDDIMDIENTTTKAPVIDAAGKTTKEIINRIEQI